MIKSIILNILLVFLLAFSFTFCSSDDDDDNDADTPADDDDAVDDDDNNDDTDDDDDNDTDDDDVTDDDDNDDNNDDDVYEGCFKDIDCIDDLTKPYCEPLYGECVECLHDENCFTGLCKNNNCELPYPDGPYGLYKDDVVENYTVYDCQKEGGPAVSLAEFYNEEGFSGMMLGVAKGWCPHCAAQIPAYNEMHEKYKDEGVIVAYVLCDGSTPNSTPTQDYCEGYASRLKVGYHLLRINNVNDPICDFTLVEQDGQIYTTAPINVFINKEMVIKNRFDGAFESANAAEQLDYYIRAFVLEQE